MPESATALTLPQRRALGGLLETTGARSARSISTRVDVLWRLKHRGFVGRTVAGDWYIKPAGKRAYEAEMAAFRKAESAP